MRKKIETLFRHGFIRSAGILVGGAAFSQAVMMLVLPLLTRLYTPEDFSLLAVYTSIVGLISVAACLRLEIAIPLPQRDEDAANLLALALCSSTVVAGLVAFCVWLLPDQIVALVSQPKLKPYLWFLPLGIWLTCFYAALQYWMTRKKNFMIIAKTRILRAIGGSGVQVVMGLASYAPIGLVVGQMINSGAGIFGMARQTIKEDHEVLRTISLSNMHRVFNEYDRFPKYSTFESLANTASVELPILMIASLAIGADAGYLILASRLLSAPIALIGGAVSQVYLSKAPDEYRAGTLSDFTANTIGGLMKVGIGPLMFVGIVAPIFFPLVFGESWQRSGVMVAWMTPWFIMQFLGSPVSMALHVTNNHSRALMLQVVGLCIRVGSILVATYWMPNLIVEFFAVSGFIFYTLYLFVIARVVKLNSKILANQLQLSAFIIAIFVFSGFAFWIAIGN